MSLGVCEKITGRKRYDMLSNNGPPHINSIAQMPTQLKTCSLCERSDTGTTYRFRVTSSTIIVIITIRIISN